MKKALTESDLKNIIKEGVKLVLREIDDGGIMQDDERLANKIKITINMLLGMFGIFCFKDSKMNYSFDDEFNSVEITYCKIDLDQLKEIAEKLLSPEINKQGYIFADDLNAYLYHYHELNENDINDFGADVGNNIIYGMKRAFEKIPQLSFISEKFSMLNCYFFMNFNRHSQKYEFTPFIKFLGRK